MAVHFNVRLFSSRPMSALLPKAGSTFFREEALIHCFMDLRFDGAKTHQGADCRNATGNGHMMKHFSYAVALLMLTCGGASADSKIKSFNKYSNITIKRGVVNGDSSFNQWESGNQHPRRFQSSPAHKP